MDPIDLGDLTVGPDPNGCDLRFTHATPRPTTTLSVTGAIALRNYLDAWLVARAAAPATWEVCPPLHHQASTLRITDA